MIRALLFDFDGLLVDTEVPTYEAWRLTYEELGAELTIEDWLPAVGSGSSTEGPFDAVAHLERLLGEPVDREAVIERRRARKRALYADAPLRPGVQSLLAAAVEGGLNTAIVTRNRDDRVRSHCATVGLDHPWDAVICANEDPMQDKAGLYRRALDDLGVEAREALAFEDSPAGLAAATSAGIRCIAVPNEITRAAAFDGADAVLPSLEGHSLDDILAALG